MLLVLAFMSSTKSHSEGIGKLFARGYKCFGNDIEMFDLLMESDFWFA